MIQCDVNLDWLISEWNRMQNRMECEMCIYDSLNETKKNMPRSTIINNGYLIVQQKPLVTTVY